MVQEMGEKQTVEQGGESRPKMTRQDVIKEIVGMVLYLACVFVVVFLIIHFVGVRTRVNGTSMEATLSDGDNLIVDKITYRFKDPERFDIIVFPPKYEEDKLFIKRIIGLPGETVRIDDNGNIYINGIVLQEHYGLDPILQPGDAAEPITLGDDEYFVLGDNRNNSTDSRFDVVGAVKRKDIVGRAWVRIYPFDEMSFIKHQ